MCIKSLQETGQQGAGSAETKHTKGRPTRMYVFKRGGPQKPALAPRPLKIYFGLQGSVHCEHQARGGEIQKSWAAWGPNTG
jgi:hypothetical protein